MGKNSKGKLSKKTTQSKNISKRDPNSSSQSVRKGSFERTESVTYTAVPLSETEETNTGLVRGASSSKSKKSKRKDKTVKKKSSKRRARTESDSESILLERKSSPVLAPLPSLTREEYDFFEMVRDGDPDEVAAFLQSDSFKDMDINKLNKSGFTILHIAVRRQDEDMVRLVLAQPGIKLYDTLLYAVREENVEIVKLLLEKYDSEATEEQKQSLINSAKTITQDPSQQEQISRMVTSSLVATKPVVSPISTRSGVKSSIKLNNSSRAVVSKKSKVKTFKSRSFYETKTNVPTTSVSQVESSADDNEEIPFDSEFSPVITPLMLAAQQGSYSLIELFYSRNERLETEEFHHDLGCSCDICAKMDGEQDMTRAYQRHNLFKALANPDYICFLGRTEHKDPINYALKKIEKIRELIEVDHAFNRLFAGVEEKLEEFITKMLELCRSTTEAEIFLSPKDSNERLPHLYPRLWYTVGQDLKKFVASPNAQNIATKLWADDWPQWNSFTTRQRILMGALRMLLWPFVGIFLWFGKDLECGRPYAAPVGRFLSYIGSYLCFLGFVSIQALYPYQRCNDQEPRYQIDDDHCKQHGPPNIGTELIIVIYVLSFYMSMLKRHSVSWFWRMRWNWIDLIDQLFFTATFGCWGYAYYWTLQPGNLDLVSATERLYWAPDCAEIIGECLLSISFLFAFGRILRFVIVVPECGKIQIGIGHQVADFVKGLLIMAVVIIAFASGLMGLYKPYEDLKGIDPEDVNAPDKEKPQDDSFHSITKTLKSLFWILHGKGKDDSTKLLVFQVEDESTGEKEEIHHDYTEWTGRVLYVSYHLIGCLMLSNMLAGYFSQTMTQIEENLDTYWKYARTELYLTFVKETVLPPPLNLIPRWQTLWSCCDWLTHLGRKEDPKASFTFRQCCYITESEKTKNWKALMKGYRKLILQLIFRYKNASTESKGEEAATKDDVLEIAEELAEIKAMLKKASENGGPSDDDDDDHQFPGGGTGAPGSATTGWTKTKTMLNSSGATFLKNKSRSGGPSGTSSGNLSGGLSGAPSRIMSGGPSGTSSGNLSGGPSGAPSGNMSGEPSGAPSRNMSGGPSGAPSGNISGGPTGARSGNMSGGASGAPSGNMSGGPSGIRSGNMSMGPPSGSPSGNMGGGNSQMNVNSQHNVNQQQISKSINVNANMSACAFSNDGTGNPSKSSNISTCPTSNQSQVTPKKPTGIDLCTGTTPPSQVSQYSPDPFPSSQSKSLKPALDNLPEIKPSMGTLSNNNQTALLNACEYSQPRRSSRNGGGLEHAPETADFFGPGNNPYNSPSKSTNVFYSIPQTPKMSPVHQNFTNTTPTSNANNFNSGAITKDQSFKTIRTLRSPTNDKPYAGVPPGITTANNNEYALPRSPSKSTNEFYSIVDVPTKSPVLQDLTKTTPTPNADKLIDVWQSTSTLASTTRDPPGDLGTPASPTSAGTKFKSGDGSPKLTEVTFQASHKPQEGDNQYSPSKSPSLVPSPAKAPTTPAKRKPSALL